MKKIFKYLSVTALSGILVMSLAVTANAQHHPGGGGGGGGGSSPAPAPRSAPAPSGQSSRPAPSQNYSRPSSAPRTSGTVRTYNSVGGQRYVQRNGVPQRVYSSGHNAG